MSFKIAFSGPESTGKSSLSFLVAQVFGGTYVPEYAREYLEKSAGKYDKIDLDVIAKEQYTSTEKASGNLIVSDTDMTVMKVWSLFKYKEVSTQIESLFQMEKFDHIFLCDVDIPWEDDPLREHPESREELFDMYLDLLNKKDVQFSIVKGSLEERLQEVKKVLYQKMK